MTTLDPGARDVLTHGAEVRPLSTAFRASSAAASMTEGLEVFVQLVIEAIATMPWSISTSCPPARVTLTGREERADPSPVWAGAPLASSWLLSGVGGSLAGKLSPRTSSPWRCETYSGSTLRKEVLASVSAMRSCGRFGPAIEGTTVERSSSRYSEYVGSTEASCHRPCSLA